MIRTPSGTLSEEEALRLFAQCGFEPPAGMPMQSAFTLFMQLVQEQQRQQPQRSRAPKGRTAVACRMEEVPLVLAAHRVTLRPMQPVGTEVQGVDTTKPLPPDLAGALEMQMAHSGLLLFRRQGSLQNESGIKGTYLTGEQQCAFTEAFGPGMLHSTHGVHPESPNRDVFRLSNDQQHGFNSVGPEWHNDGSFCRDVFGHVVYHIVKAPTGRGDTRFAHLGLAFDLLSPEQKERYRSVASVNSNGGVVHPLVHDHPLSGRRSLYLHTGMTGAIIERTGAAAEGLEGIHAWTKPEMDSFFCEFTEMLDRPDVHVSHKWEEGDVVIIDNLAVAHKAAPGAHTLEPGLRILHRTTSKGSGPLDPDPTLKFPLILDTKRRCPFGKDAVWVEGYVGFRWGDWESRSLPH